MENAATESNVLKISCCETDRNVSCHAKVVYGWRPRRGLSQSPAVKNARQEDKTNYVGGDTLADKMQIVDLTDRYMRTAEITNSWQFEKLIELLLMEKRKSSLQVYRQ